jgi:hypothetical protein
MQVATAEVATPVVVAPAPAPVPPKPKLHPKNFHDAVTQRNIWRVVPADGVRYEELFRPEYWASVSNRLRAGDLIEVTAEDGSYFALLYVLVTATQAARVYEFQKIDLQGENAELPDVGAGYEVKWKGPVLQWTVIRTLDNVRVATNLGDRASANEALANHLKALR